MWCVMMRTDNGKLCVMQVFAVKIVQGRMQALCTRLNLSLPFVSMMILKPYRNLSESFVVQERESTQAVVCIVILMRLRIHRKHFATIAPCIGKSVPVALWELQPRDEKLLDRYEGYPSHYFKQELPVKLNNGSEITAMVYIMNLKQQFGLPSANYYDTVS